MDLGRSMSNPPENAWYQILERYEPLCELSCWGGMSNYTLYVWERGGGGGIQSSSPERRPLSSLGVGATGVLEPAGITFFRNSWGWLLKTAIIKI